MEEHGINTEKAKNTEIIYYICEAKI